MKISAEVLNVLEQLTIKGNQVRTVKVIVPDFHPQRSKG